MARRLKLRLAEPRRVAITLNKDEYKELLKKMIDLEIEDEAEVLKRALRAYVGLPETEKISVDEHIENQELS